MKTTLTCGCGASVTAEGTDDQVMGQVKLFRADHKDCRGKPEPYSYPTPWRFPPPNRPTPIWVTPLPPPTPDSWRITHGAGS